MILGTIIDTSNTEKIVDMIKDEKNMKLKSKKIYHKYLYYKMHKGIYYKTIGHACSTDGEAADPMCAPHVVSYLMRRHQQQQQPFNFLLHVTMVV